MTRRSSARSSAIGLAILQQRFTEPRYGFYVASDFTIDNVYPWGRTFDEYRRMFALSEKDLCGKILGCADGPASFNAEMNSRGQRVISCDPLYQFDAATIGSRVAATAEKMIRNARENAHRFVWDRIKSPEHMAQLRLTAMGAFLADYEMGRNEGRYITAKLPTLPFANKQFDLALCAHFLFLYSEELSYALHIAAVKEMCRLAHEVRIFSLRDMSGEKSAHVEPLMEELRRDGWCAKIESVDYEFQRGGNQMMRITGA